MGMIGDRRGDAYMNSMQPALTSCPWFPIIGNHESDDGDSYKHYEAMAFGEVAFQVCRLFKPKYEVLHSMFAAWTRRTQGRPQTPRRLGPPCRRTVNICCMDYPMSRGIQETVNPVHSTCMSSL